MPIYMTWDDMANVDQSLPNDFTGVCDEVLDHLPYMYYRFRARARFIIARLQALPIVSLLGCVHNTMIYLLMALYYVWYYSLLFSEHLYQNNAIYVSTSHHHLNWTHYTQ